MTATTTATAANGSDRAAAAEMWHRAAATGEDVSARELAERFGRSPRWGRDVIARCRDAATAPAGTGQVPGSAPTLPVAAPRAVRWVTTAAVAVVALVAAAASYTHMRHLALEAGEGAMSWALPLSVDGMLVAASMTLLTAKRSGQRAGVLPWAALLLGLGASLAANVGSAEPTLVGRLVAAWPPVALGVSFELLLRQYRPANVREDPTIDAQEVTR